MEYPDPGSEPNPLSHADLDVNLKPSTPFYRPEPIAIFQQLPHLRPSVLYVFGSQSALSAPAAQAAKMAATGVGVGGSGGAEKGRVDKVVLDAGHLIPMEKVAETGSSIVEWVTPELARWHREEKLQSKGWEKIEREQRSVMGEDFVKVITGNWFNTLGKMPKEGKAKL